MLSYLHVSHLLLPLMVYCAPAQVDIHVGRDVNSPQANFAATLSSSAKTDPPTTTTGASSPLQIRPAAVNSSQSTSSTQPLQSPLVMAYYPDWAGPSYPPENIAFSRFDWIDFAFGLPTQDFDVSWDSEETPKLLRRLIAAARAHRTRDTSTKIKLSIGGWTGSKYFSQAVATPESRYSFASNILSIYNDYQLDGIDLDWEYPGRKGADGNQVNSQDSENFLAFLHCLRSVLPAGARITAAAQTVPFTDASGEPTKDVSQFAKVLDWLLLMNYDVWGSSPNPGPNAPMFDACQNSTQPEGNAAAAYDKWTSAGFPAIKLVLGLPAYGYVSASKAPGLRQRRSSSTNHTQAIQSRKGDPTVHGQVKVVSEDGSSSEGQVTFVELVRQGALVLVRPADANRTASFDGAGGFERHWDRCSGTPYLRSSSAGQVISYDDPESLYMKAEFASKVGMLGVNIFDTHGDTDQWDMTDAARKGLKV